VDDEGGEGETQVPVEGRNITPTMLARHRDVLQEARRKNGARFIGREEPRIYAEIRADGWLHGWR